MALDYNGSMRLKLATKTVMHEIEASFSGSTSFQELASKDITGKDYNPQDRDWSFSGNGYADNSDADAQIDLQALADSWKADDVIAGEFTDDVSGNLAVSGNGYLENFEIQSTNKEKVTYSFTFKGKGLPSFGLNA